MNPNRKNTPTEKIEYRIFSKRYSVNAKNAVPNDVLIMNFRREVRMSRQLSLSHVWIVENTGSPRRTTMRGEHVGG